MTEACPPGTPTLFPTLVTHSHPPYLDDCPLTKCFSAFPLSNKIRVKCVLGVFDPVESEYDIGFSRFLTGYATIA